MKYAEVKFRISPYSQDAADLLAALAADAGLDGFTECRDGVRGYAPSRVLDCSLLDRIVCGFPLKNTLVSYTVAEAEDRDWNETWENNFFSCLITAGKVLVHNGRAGELPQTEYNMVIHPRQAFGTGGHQTTGMIIEQLYGMDLHGQTVVDAGCGTGILGIFCIMKGAGSVLAYDIDEWSVKNTLENMRLNNISGMTVEEGDVSVLKGKGPFDLVLANINRNILMADLPAFASIMHQGSQMILSGFYTEDIPLLLQATETHGLHCARKMEKEHWAALSLEKA